MLLLFIVFFNVSVGVRYQYPYCTCSMCVVSSDSNWWPLHHCRDYGHPVCGITATVSAIRKGGFNSYSTSVKIHTYNILVQQNRTLHDGTRQRFSRSSSTTMVLKAVASSVSRSSLSHTKLFGRQATRRFSCAFKPTSGARKSAVGIEVLHSDWDVEAPASKIDPACIVNSHTEWDPLEEVIVGRVEDATIPEWHVSGKAVWPSKHWDMYKNQAGLSFPKELVQKGNR